jgi:hypothetical protein
MPRSQGHNASMLAMASAAVSSRGEIGSRVGADRHSESQVPGSGATAAAASNAAAVGRHIEVRGAVFEIHGTSIH